jgi:hypothetical protein
VGSAGIDDNQFCRKSFGLLMGWLVAAVPLATKAWLWLRM